MTPDALKQILDAHKAWLEGKKGGKRANLQSANLQSANLQSADLQSANLRYANLRYANLQSANLAPGFKAVGLVSSVDRSDGYRFLAWRTDNGNQVQAGCRFMTPDAYRVHISREYPNTDKALETAAIIDFFAARFRDTPK